MLRMLLIKLLPGTWSRWLAGEGGAFKAPHSRRRIQGGAGSGRYLLTFL